mmetsp:Transcript_5024/g.11638  ORF Transcript_5024/g.11638 Transcript_5024/m.11638 type:complete len:275 (-) Transcript_5024:122-946(-)
MISCIAHATLSTSATGDSSGCRVSSSPGARPGSFLASAASAATASRHAERRGSCNKKPSASSSRASSSTRCSRSAVALSRPRIRSEKRRGCTRKGPCSISLAVTPSALSLRMQRLAIAAVCSSRFMCTKSVGGNGRSARLAPPPSMAGGIAMICETTACSLTSCGSCSTNAPPDDAPSAESGRWARPCDATNCASAPFTVGPSMSKCQQRENSSLDEMAMRASPASRASCVMRTSSGRPTHDAHVEERGQKSVARWLQPWARKSTPYGLLAGSW